MPTLTDRRSRPPRWVTADQRERAERDRERAAERRAELAEAMGAPRRRRPRYTVQAGDWNVRYGTTNITYFVRQVGVATHQAAQAVEQMGYRLAEMYQQVYTQRPREPEPVTVTPGEDVARVDITYRSEPYATYDDTWWSNSTATWTTTSATSTTTANWTPSYYTTASSATNYTIGHRTYYEVVVHYHDGREVVMRPRTLLTWQQWLSPERNVRYYGFEVGSRTEEVWQQWIVRYPGTTTARGLDERERYADEHAQHQIRREMAAQRVEHHSTGSMRSYSTDPAERARRYWRANYRGPWRVWRDIAREWTKRNAEAVAEDLLLGFLSPAQREEWTRHRHVTVVGASGVHYRLSGKVWSGNIEVVKAPRHAQRAKRYCVHYAERTPYADLVLGQLLALSTAEGEAELLRVANPA